MIKSIRICVKKIEKLELMPGAYISEKELCTLYGVTRHVVRGAITLAKERKLLEVYPQRGTFVSLIDMGYVEDILFVRESLEKECLRRIMALSDDEIMALSDKLHDNIEFQRASLDEGIELDRFYEIDAEFHGMLFEAVDKKHSMELIRDHYIHVRRWRNYDFKSDSKRLEEIIKEHMAIIEGIKNKNVDEACNSMHMHLDTVTRFQNRFKDTQSEYFIFR